MSEESSSSSKKKVVAIFYDKDDDSVACRYSDDEKEAVECFNCSSRDLSAVLLYLHTDSPMPQVLEGVPTTRRGSLCPSSLNQNEAVIGICWDEECIEFSEARVTLTEAPQG